MRLRGLYSNVQGTPDKRGLGLQLREQITVLERTVKEQQEVSSCVLLGPAFVCGVMVSAHIVPAATGSFHVARACASVPARHVAGVKFRAGVNGFGRAAVSSRPLSARWTRRGGGCACSELLRQKRTLSLHSAVCVEITGLLVLQAVACRNRGLPRSRLNFENQRCRPLLTRA